MSNIDDIIAQAQAQALAVVPLAPLAPLAVVPSAGAGVAYNMSQDAFLNPGGMEVASYIQVKDAGIKLSKDWDGYIDDFDAIIDLTEVQFFMGIRKEVGNTVTYAKTYDGISTQRGEPFGELVENFKRDSQKPADTYRGADIPMTLVSAMADPKNKAKVLEADTCVGLSTSITGFKPWANFHKKLSQGGLGNATLKVKVKHAPRKNAANQAYGVCEFELIEVIGADQIAA